MNRKSPLLNYENNWVTSMGGSVLGETVKLRQKDLFEDFKKSSWMNVLLYGITGRSYDKKQCELFEAIWKISTSYPEPRVWNNRVASLAATTRSTGNLGISAGIAVSEATIYGQGPMVRVMSFLLRVEEKLSNGMSLDQVVDDELKKYNRIFGFGRPIIEGDERIDPLFEIAEQLGFSNGKYVKLLFEIKNKLLNGPKKLEMNVAALDAALCADQGFDVREFYLFMSLSFSAGITFCFSDSSSKLEGAFLPFRCKSISYSGHLSRVW